MKQISIISKNDAGAIAEISTALAKHDINIEDFVSESFGKHAVTILSVDRYDEALKIIQRLPEMKAITEDAILIKIEDKPGALAQIALRFKEAGISMQSIRIVDRGDHGSFAAISTDQTEEAMALVKDLKIGVGPR